MIGQQLCTTLDSVNPVLYPSIDTILIKLCVLLTMPIASATAERSFILQRCLKNYARSTMKNDRLSSLGLVHIHRDFEVDLYKAMEMIVSAKTRTADFWTMLNSCLSKSLKLYLILCYMKSSSKENPRPPPPLKNYDVHTIDPQLRP